jgi:hypothetical protein
MVFDRRLKLLPIVQMYVSRTAHCITRVPTRKSCVVATLLLPLPWLLCSYWIACGMHGIAIVSVHCSW